MNVRLSHHRSASFSLRTTGRTTRERGYVMLMFALLLVPLLLMAGFAVDVGYWYNRASDIQKATDAAALAGVVFLPDETKARTAALAAAAKNGFPDSHPDIEVVVTRSPQSPRRLRVKITDDRVGSFFYESIVGDQIEIGRDAAAEYVLPVPMGSPRNYFGTGRLSATGELLYQSVNPYCTDKYDGDRFQSRRFGNSGTGGSTSNCTGGTANTEYNDDEGYEIYVEVPKTRSSNIEVRLYDARYSSLNAQIQTGQNCTTSYPSSWTEILPAPTSSNPYTLAGPAYWSTYSFFGWGSQQTLAKGSTRTFTGRVRVRIGTESCTPVYGNEAAIDSLWGNSIYGTIVSEPYTYRLFEADDTPLDDSDNELVPSTACAGGNPRTFNHDTAFDGYEYLGSARWNTLCTITPSMPSGRYILRVRNAGVAGSRIASGSNQWGVVARYASATGDGLCDGRTDASCPRVFGKEAISVYANTSAKTASFFLAEIEPEHEGKELRLELWDPGEGGLDIQIMRPTGANAWTPHPFSWKAGSASGNNVTTLDVTNSKFNGKLVEITVNLEGYAPPSNNRWWQIAYEFSSGSVTDRTTWTARIVGDPVHLVEEEE